MRRSKLTQLWLAEFVSDNGHCCLCGNRGVIDTRGKVFTPVGLECGKRVHCICPNGRALRKQQPVLDKGEPKP